MRDINVAVVGIGARGHGNLKTILNLPAIKVKAVCDIYEDRCQDGIDIVTKSGQEAPFASCDYRDVISRDDVEAVLIFTNWEVHIEIAIASMKAGKAVGMEVGGACSIEECLKLVACYEETKMPFMMLENCCFGKDELLALNMVRDGLFGDIVHCHGAYAHDLREEICCGKENRHYRLEHYINRNCENYPTHELGPIAKILDINRGNRMVRLVSMASKSMGLKRYVDDRKDTIVNKDLIGKEFNQGDIVNTLITCANGETISIKLDTTLPRSYSRELAVRGTKGLYEQSTNTVFLDGDKHLFETKEYYKDTIDNAAKYEDEYLPDYWKNITQEEIDMGHGGMDIFSFTAFFNALRENRPMPIDVYDTASWMCITALSEESIAKGNIPIEIPDFTNGAWKTRPRFDEYQNI